MRALQRLVSISACAGLAFSAARSAHAGCPPDCDVDQEPTLIEPPLPECVRAEVKLSTECGCDLRFELHNDCETAVTAHDFEFGYCSALTSGGCTQVEPGTWASKAELLEERGEKQFDYALETEQGQHQVTVRLNVRSFEDQGGCAVSGRPAQGSGVLLAAGIGALALVRRRHSDRARRRASKP